MNLYNSFALQIYVFFIRNAKKIVYARLPYSHTDGLISFCHNHSQNSSMNFFGKGVSKRRSSPVMGWVKQSL